MLVSDRRSRKAGKDHERERQRAVAETKRMNKQMTNVLESPITAKHLIISLGEKTFLALPKRGMLADGHCTLHCSAYHYTGSPRHSLLPHPACCPSRQVLLCGNQSTTDAGSVCDQA